MTKLTLAYLFTLLALATISTSCEKEDFSTSPNSINDTISEPSEHLAKNNCNDLFAVTEAPNSEIVQMDFASYAFIGSQPLIGYAILNNPATITDIKGISRFLGGYYVTTGPNNPWPYENALLKIDPYAGVVTQHVASLGMTVSDICFVDKNFGGFFGFVGLEDNSNNLVWIPYVGNGGPAPFAPPIVVPMTGVAQGYTASGLTWHNSSCTQQFELYATASSSSSFKAQVLKVDPVSAATANIDILIGADFQGAHLAAGWVYCTEELQVGHADSQAGGFTFYGQLFSCNKLAPWSIYNGAFSPFPYEDFCTIPYEETNG